MGRNSGSTWSRTRVFVMFAAVIVGVTVAAAVVGVDTTVVATTQSDAQPSQTQPKARSAASTSTLLTTAAAPSPDQALRAAMAPLAANKTGDFSVAVLDQTTGATASYNPNETYDTASIVKADILAVLLLQAQKQGTPLTNDEDTAATQMIENSDNDSATTLWDDVGSAAGMATGNAALGLKTTVPGSDDYWGLTTTTVADQLAVMRALTSPSSILDSASRSYALGLMHQIEADQVWGVSAAANPGTQVALKNGWLPVDDNNDLWAINSVGEVSHGGRGYLVAVLSSSQPDEQTGINQASAVAKAAVTALAGS
jgi:Beta-lactamase enzyme family